MVKAVRGAELTEKQKKARTFQGHYMFVYDVKRGGFNHLKKCKIYKARLGMNPKCFAKIVGRIFLEDVERGTAVDQPFISDFTF